ncbi:MAG: hypothetical protein KKG84_01530 [Candidatus Omnitrophica bacterium]|nr:hypothetical protein [Candidatus Omnitrophota bacterium]
MGKILVAGIVVSIFNAIVGMVTCGGIFSWVYKLEPTNIWKPMEGPPGIEFFIGSFILSIILVFIYALINKGIPGKNKLAKGLVFGLGVWAVGILPGMLATYSFMTMSTTVVIYLTIMGLIKTPLVGLIIAAIYGE